MATIETLSPITGKALRSYELHSLPQASEKIRQAREAQGRWGNTPFSERARTLRKLAEILDRDKARLADLIRNEMGKSQAESLAELEKCVACARYYAEQGAHFLRPLEIPTEAARSFVSFEPLGLVLAIMPWNFPFWQTLRCVIPATFAGNAVVLKHASNVAGCALATEEILAEALGEHRDLFKTLLLKGSAALELIALPEVSAVSFTGSTEVGKSIAAAAGAELKKCVLELGGSDAYVVLANANLEKAAETCAKSRLINAGQSCIAAKRFIVEKSVAQKFTELLTEQLSATIIAPLARADLRDDLQSQVDRSVALGAQLRCGGKIPAGEGFFYPPTLLSDVKPGMPVFDEETFGPVAAVVEAANADDAIRLANRSPFGLGAAIFTADIERGIRLAQNHLEAGSCFVNSLVRSDPRLPFGGIKKSGYGRELAEFGLKEFVNVKTVYAERG